MDARTLRFIASACGGRLVGGQPDALVTRICKDSREIRAGDLFVALVGERFDGHAFLDEVAGKGAVAVLANEDGAVRGPAECATIFVPDTRRALGQLAAAYRSDFDLPIVAVGGSNGKTTTKELIAAVWRQRFTTLWSEASFNNDIGVPMTLLRLEKKHQAAVLETGTNHPGELAPLVGIVRPNYGVITCVGREHLEFFGDLAGVANEEGALAEMLPETGRLFLAGDGEWAKAIAARARAAVVRVGLGEDNDWRVRGVRPDTQGVRFRVDAPKAEFGGDYRVGLLGRHQAVNATFAIALGAELGLSRAEVQRGLLECKPARMRLQLWELNGVRVLDDAYNANADSMLAALETLRQLPCKGRRVAVLGDMAELGACSEAAHEEVGRRAAELGVSQLFAVGKMASVMARGARGAGLSRIFEFPSVEAAALAVRSFVRRGDTLLLKASRATGLERVAELLRAGEALKRN